MLSQVGSVDVDVRDFRQIVGLVQTAVDDADCMAGIDQLPNKGQAQKPGAAEDQESHRRTMIDPR